MPPYHVISKPHLARVHGISEEQIYVSTKAKGEDGLTAITKDLARKYPDADVVAIQFQGKTKNQINPQLTGVGYHFKSARDVRLAYSPEADAKEIMRKRDGYLILSVRDITRSVKSAMSSASS
ncbi:hypothetical protein [Rubrobacter calidifluminis]|uniref:hypothetical protein n=1 Tax=Rubrobacter calidifluminis TaxID=1392640 RepID=UPI00235FC0F6|nr:hypothetical protein [Rubrobacter calidifluminis]